LKNFMLAAPFDLFMVAPKRHQTNLPYVREALLHAKKQAGNKRHAGHGMAAHARRRH